MRAVHVRAVHVRADNFLPADQAFHQLDLDQSATNTRAAEAAADRARSRLPPVAVTRGTPAEPHHTTPP